MQEIYEDSVKKKCWEMRPFFEVPAVASLA